MNEMTVALQRAARRRRPEPIVTEGAVLTEETLNRLRSNGVDTCNFSSLDLLERSSDIRDWVCVNAEFSPFPGSLEERVAAIELALARLTSNDPLLAIGEIDARLRALEASHG